MNMESIDWRDKNVVRYVSAFDTILAIFMFGFYLIGGVFFNTLIVDIQNGPLSKFTLVLSSTAIWVLVFFITYLQMSTAYDLFIVTYQDALGPQVTIQRSQNWIRVCFVILGLILVKIVYLSTREAPVFPFVWFLCGLQIFIRVLGLYFVRESIDDLKREVFLLRKATSTSKFSEIENLSIRRKSKKGNEKDDKEDVDEGAGDAKV